LDLVKGIMFAQKFRYLYSKLPTDDNPPAWKVFVYSATVFKWNFST